MTDPVRALMERANARRATGQSMDDWNDDRARARYEIVDSLPALLARIDALTEALADIREMTDPDGIDNYRGDDREGCLDTVFAVAARTLPG